MKRGRRAIMLAGAACAVLLGGGVAVAACQAGSEQATPAAPADGPSFTTLADLVRGAQLVASVRVLSVGAPYVVPADPAQVSVAPPPRGGPAGKEDPSLPPEQPGGSDPAPGVRKVDVTVEVLEAVRGAGAAAGERIIVAQVAGGVDAAGDPLMRAGSREVLFLQSDPTSGKFFTVGGGQGRFLITDADTVQAVAPDSPLGQAFNGVTLPALREAIQAA